MRSLASSLAVFAVSSLFVPICAASACVDHTQGGADKRSASGPSSRTSTSRPTSRPAKPRPDDAAKKAAKKTAKKTPAELLEQHGGKGSRALLEARKALPDISAFDSLLRRAVRSERVDYALVRRERKVLEAYLAAIAKFDLAKVDKVAQLATYINTYNAATLVLVLDHVLGKGPEGSDLIGVLDVEKNGGIKFFDSKQVVVGGEKLTLNELESKGRALGDARIHFAVNCASISCPALLGRAWKAATLEEDLAAATRSYLRNTEGLRLANRRVSVSKIFEWYAKDWGGLEGVRNFLMLYAPEAAKEALGAELSFHEYDWRLNAAR